jgi:putative ABC transport system ATP-binding protein
MPVLVDSVTVEYRSGDSVLRPLDGMDLQAASGELILLLGASGCGKTTLLSVLAGILSPTAGRVVVDGVEVTALDADGLVRYRRNGVGVVFQAFNLIPSLTAAENVQAPLRVAGVRPRAARARAGALLERVGLADRAGHRPDEMSGGQQQRVAIARALAHDPALIVADEPTAHLDIVQCEVVVELLRDLASDGRTVIVATHDDRLLPIADQVIELTPRFASTGARLVELAPGEVLFREGDPSDAVYLVEGGEVEVVRPRPDGTEEVLATLGPGRYVGELGPLLGLPRSATARAVTGAVLRSCAPQEFRHAVGSRGTGDPSRPEPASSAGLRTRRARPLRADAALRT